MKIISLFQQLILTILVLLLNQNVASSSPQLQFQYPTDLSPKLGLIPREVEITEGYIQTNPSLSGHPVSLFWTRWRPLGVESTRKVLCHKGWLSSLHLFSQLAYHLAVAGDYEVVTFSSRGGAPSPSPSVEEDYTVENFFSDQKVVADFHWTNSTQYTFIGYSLGALIGYAAALNMPHRIEQLVVAAPIPVAGVHVSAEKFNLGYEQWARAKNGDLTSQYEIYQRIASDFTDSEYASKGFEAIDDLDNSIGLGCSLEHYLGGFKMIQSPGFGSKLTSLRVPTLMILGDHDELFHFQQRDQYKFSKVFLTLKIIENGKHSIIKTHFSVFFQTIFAFIQSYRPKQLSLSKPVDSMSIQQQEIIR